MKKMTIILSVIAMALSLAMTACAGDCQNSRNSVQATDTLPAYHTMISGKTCNHSSRVAGTISSTCLYNEDGKLEYHRLVRSCECNSLPDVTKPGVADIIRGLQHIGESCQKEWYAIPDQYHPLYK